MTHVIGWIAYVLAWALAAVIYALILVAQGYTTFFEGITSSAVTMGVGGVAGVGVWWLSGRYPLPERFRSRFFARHLLLGAGYAGLCVGALYLWLLIAAGSAIAGTVMATAAVWMLAQYLMLYAVIAGVSYQIRTLRRLRAQQLAVARAEAAAVRAQLVALRSQLNPHFLFNSLHSLSTLVRHDPDAAEQAIEQLGALLRYALDRGGSDLVYLDDEWAFTRTYLDLEQMRLGARLHVVAELTGDALDCVVPPFLLQPLIENAVRHGVAARPNGARLDVRAAVRSGHLVIEVHDDGAGADPTAVDDAGGVGLRAVREQLRSRYDSRGSLVIDTAPGKGFHVRVELPADGGAEANRRVSESAHRQPAGVA